MLNRSASLAMSTSVLKALPGKLDIKRNSPSILYLHIMYEPDCYFLQQDKEVNLTCLHQCCHQLKLKNLNVVIKSARLCLLFLV